MLGVVLLWPVPPEIKNKVNSAKICHGNSQKVAGENYAESLKDGTTLVNAKLIKVNFKGLNCDWHWLSSVSRQI